MKKKFSDLAFVFIAFILFVNLNTSHIKTVPSSVSAVFSKSSSRTYHDDTLPEELLDSEYGTSEYWQQIGNVKASLATTTYEKHFIRYSWANYDLSNFTVKLFIEDIYGNDLNRNAEVNAMLKYNNNINTAFYCETLDFPTDDPLGYKQTVILYFYPLEGNPDTVELTLYYDDKVFILQDVNIVI